jgi:hypothetical protein
MYTYIFVCVRVNASLLEPTCIHEVTEDPSLFDHSAHVIKYIPAAIACAKAATTCAEALACMPS